MRLGVVMSRDDEEKMMYESIIFFADVFKNKIDETKVYKLASILSVSFTPDQVSKALAKCTESCDFFPSVAEIRTAIFGQKNVSLRLVGSSVAGDIIEAIPRFGYYQAGLAKKHLGEAKWAIVERSGGWQFLCTSSPDKVTTLLAQMRDQTESCITLGEKRCESLQVNSSDKRLGHHLEALEPPEDTLDY